MLQEICQELWFGLPYLWVYPIIHSSNIVCIMHFDFLDINFYCWYKETALFNIAYLFLEQDYQVAVKAAS